MKSLFASNVPSLSRPSRHTNAFVRADPSCARSFLPTSRALLDGTYIGAYLIPSVDPLLSPLGPSPGYNEKTWEPKKPWKRRGWNADGELKPLEPLPAGEKKKGQTTIPPITQTHSIVLARGGPYVEPMVQFKKCPGGPTPVTFTQNLLPDRNGV